MFVYKWEMTNWPEQKLRHFRFQLWEAAHGVRQMELGNESRRLKAAEGMQLHPHHCR